MISSWVVPAGQALLISVAPPDHLQHTTTKTQHHLLHARAMQIAWSVLSPHLRSPPQIQMQTMHCVLKAPSWSQSNSKRKASTCLAVNQLFSPGTFLAACSFMRVTALQWQPRCERCPGLSTHKTLSTLTPQAWQPNTAAATAGTNCKCSHIAGTLHVQV